MGATYGAGNAHSFRNKVLGLCLRIDDWFVCLIMLSALSRTFIMYVTGSQFILYISAGSDHSPCVRARVIITNCGHTTISVP